MNNFIAVQPDPFVPYGNGNGNGPKIPEPSTYGVILFIIIIGIVLFKKIRK